MEKPPTLAPDERTLVRDGGAGALASAGCALSIQPLESTLAVIAGALFLAASSGSG